jgi:CheY-like chemotaxis protein
MKNILVVDDDSIMLQLIKRILEREGIVAHCAESGEDALDKVTKRTFSLMITDFNMPGMDGLELSRKGLEIAPGMSIIMSTGSISQKITRLANETGISRVLAKPFLLSELLNAIRDVLGKRSDWASSLW